jgi:hypothetical protein
VLFDYEKSHPDDLGCAAGEVVYLVTKVNDDWYMCKKKHTASAEEGMVPATFLDVLVPVRHSSSSSGTATPTPPSLGVAATALFDFEGQVEGDLSFPVSFRLSAVCRVLIELVLPW